VDEAQDVDVEKFDKDFRPMAASRNVPVVYWGTPWAPDSLLQQMKVANLAAEARDGRRRHFEFPWEVVAVESDAYRAYVEGERERLGGGHPLFRTQYCLEVVSDADRMFDAAAIAQTVGTHQRVREPRVGEVYVAGLDIGGAHRLDAEGMAANRDRDWTVLTIARLRPRVGALAALEVVEHNAWHGEATEPLVEQLADRLRRVWRVRRVAVDASGLGRPVADLLQARIRGDTVDQVVFTRPAKSALGFGLMAAVHGGRLQVYANDDSAEWTSARRQLELARATYLDQRTMDFAVDPAEDHDDYLMSLALCVRAAGTDSGPRRATGA